MKNLKTKNVAVSIIVSVLYVVLVYAFAPISFHQIQIRIANVLIGLVPLLGWAGIYGLTLGVLLGNLSSPLGPIDLLSVIPSFLGLIAVYKLRKVSIILGLQIYSTLISIWVAFMLYLVFNLPYFVTFIYVFIGVTIATTGLGYLLYKSAIRFGFNDLLKESVTE
ncbi:QueT transporter family protein [[Eubacterium] cellulosolvens]